MDDVFRFRAAGPRASGSSFRARLALVLSFLLGSLPAATSKAAPLSDPQVDAYNVRVGTQTFAGLYQFTRTNLLVETAQAILGMGSDTIKMYLGANYPRQYHTNLAANVTNLLTLARDDPNCRAAFDLPFRRVIAWAYPLSNPDAPFQGTSYTATEQANDYRELYDLTRYLLTNYNNSGRTFYLGHWEGDGYLNVNNWTTNPSPVVVTNMILWENTRQKGVDDARAATTYSNVSVFYYLEVNRVRDAMFNGPTNNVRVVNAVLPYVTNLDFVSYSSYDAMNLSTSSLYATLDYVEASIPPVPTAKTSLLPAERLWIGEYGWGGYSTATQEPLNRAYIQRLLNYGRQALPFILFWEIYNNETNKLFCLIDSNNVKTASYYLHQRFINSGRLLAARFKESNGRLPTDAEFVSMVSPLLGSPLPAPVPLALSSLNASPLSATSVQISATLTQGVYGDDQAAVWAFWGPQDGGTNRSAWANGLSVGVNTNFNPAVFTATVTNLPVGGTWFFRFYATNATGEIWAPVSAQFNPPALNPADYGSRLRIFFPGYNRSETLANFPVLVSLGPGLPGFSYRQFASPTGGDLRFADASGLVQVPYDIDEWNTNGVSSVWVRVPRLSGPGDSIWAYWGNPLATNPPASTVDGTVWSVDHLLVWHLKETGFPYADSAQQFAALSGVAPAATTGVVGRGVAFSGSQYLNAGAVNLGDTFTLSAWVNVVPGAFDIQTVWANQKGGYASPGFAFFVNTYLTNNQVLDFASGDGVNGDESTTGTGAVSFGAWHLLSASVNRLAGTADLFVDGANVLHSSSVVKTLANQATLNLARFTNSAFYFHGAMDEARIQTGTISSNWAWASWMTVVSNAALAGYSSVTQQTARLSVGTAGSDLVVSWPPSGVGLTLYSATNLQPPITWNPVTNLPSFVGTQWQTTIPPAASAGFYRLQSN